MPEVMQKITKKFFANYYALHRLSNATFCTCDTCIKPASITSPPDELNQSTTQAENEKRLPK